MSWITTVKAGDIVTLASAIGMTVSLGTMMWQNASGTPTRAIIRAGGQVVASIQLPTKRQLSIPGPLGNTLILIDGQRVKITEDPGPKQYCVEQSWLEHTGDIGLCLPNEVSVQLLGTETLYDTYSY